MKLRNKYILFVALLHIIVLVLSWFIFTENKIIFLIAEAGLLISLSIAWQLYNELIRPLQLLLQGTDAIRDKDFSVKLVPTGKPELDQLIGVYNKMMDELRTERTQQKMQHVFLEKLIHSSPTGILILDYDQHIRQANPKALELLQLEAHHVLQAPFVGLMHPVAQQIVQLKSGQSKTIQLGAATYKLQKSHFIDQGFPRHFILIEDLTAEVLAAEKKTYGTVIRMMAHEVNNTIGPVNSIIQSVLGSQQHAPVLADAMQVAIERNQHLNQFMRNFASLVQLPLPVRRPVDLHVLLRHVARLLQFGAGEKQIEILYELNTRSLTIPADGQQMEQVLINILKNSLEAMGPEGTITLVTQAHPKQLIIRDTGAGISPETGDQLFSPFYSTKKDGQGIGLALIREILTNHGFSFSLKTVAPGRTEFSIGFE